MQLDGMTGGEPGPGGGGNRNATDEVINSALRYRVQAPLIDDLLRDIGIEGGNLSRMGGLIREASDMQRIARSTSGSGRDDAEPASESSRREDAGPGDGGSDRTSGS